MDGDWRERENVLGGRIDGGWRGKWIPAGWMDGGGRGKWIRAGWMDVEEE